MLTDPAARCCDFFLLCGFLFSLTAIPVCLVEDADNRHHGTQMPDARWWQLSLKVSSEYLAWHCYQLWTWSRYMRRFVLTVTSTCGHDTRKHLATSSGWSVGQWPKIHQYPHPNSSVAPQQCLTMRSKFTCHTNSCKISPATTPKLALNC